MKYVVTGEVTISVQVEVEAKSEAEARRLANEAPMQTICAYCSRNDDGEWSTGGDLDGEPKIVEVRKRGSA